MATQHSRAAARLMITPAVAVLLIWMVVPLVMTIWFSFQQYNLLYPDRTGFAGWDNYHYFVTDFRFWGRDPQHAGAGSGRACRSLPLVAS